MGALGWSFFPPVRGEDGSYPATKGETGEDDGIAEVTRDPLYNSKFIRELYFKANPEYDGRCVMARVGAISRSLARCSFRCVAQVHRSRRLGQQA